MTDNSIDGISMGEDGSKLEFGNPDDGRGIGNDALDIATDFGKDMEWAGESMYDTTVSAAETLGSDVKEAAESFGSDVIHGHPIDAVGDVIGGVWDAGVDVVEGAGIDAFEAAAGAFAGVSAVATDAWDVGADVVNDIGDGIEDLVGSNVVDGIEGAYDDVSDAIGDAADAAAQFSGDVVTDIGDGVDDLIDDIGDLF